MGATNQLAIPEEALRDEKSFELARVWVANKGQHVSLRIGTWEDPSAWGIVLADLARHVANGYKQDMNLDPIETVARIKKLFLAELDSPTDEPTGTVLKM
ncbi:MAG TPA: DUF5076 domain-containing protein [Candidatus Dormibacteraeota bacterium]|jgi:hypothetical protein|nr:DUF5076 domain-containing protein [Candidatus Dormibacteraeota bacterium]